MLDAINHSRFFQSGKDQYRISGYWKLKDTSIPFVENIASEEYCFHNGQNSVEQTEQHNHQMGTMTGHVLTHEMSSSNEDSYVQQSMECNDIQSAHSITHPMGMCNQQLQSMHQYYLLNIQMLRTNNQMLLQLYNQNTQDQMIQQHIISEIQKNEMTIRQHSQQLYNISQCDDTWYTSGCLTFRSVF